MNVYQTGSKTGPMRNGPFRLDLPDYSPGENPDVRWLREMVERRRAEQVPSHGAVFHGEEKDLRRVLRK